MGSGIVAAIPSYGRPHTLAKAIESLGQGSVIPEQILVSVPAHDKETVEYVAQNHPDVLVIAHDGWGHIPPLMAVGHRLQNHSCRWLYIMDDDATVHHNTLQRLKELAEKKGVVGVGGRVHNIIDGVAVVMPAVSVVGSMACFGKLYGGFHSPYLGDVPVSVRHLPGGNMMWDRALFCRVPWDLRLNRYIARRYEVALGESMLLLGEGGIWYDPDAVIDHFPAPRAHVDARYERERQARSTGFSYFLILRRYQRSGWRLLSFLWWLFWGDAESPGPLRGLPMLLTGRPQTLSRVWQGWLGRMEGLRQPVVPCGHDG